MSLEHEAILPSTLDPITTDAHNIVAFDSTTSEARRITTETTLTNSDTKTPTSGAVYDYVAQYIASIDAMVYKGVQDCSTNPNYPAGDAGNTYRISVAGKIGGASGINVEIGDLILCNTDGTASGNQATVGSYWNIIQTNLDGAVTMSANAGATDEIILSAGANKTQKTSSKTFQTAITDDDTKVPTSGAIVDYALPLAGGTISGYTALGSDAPKIKIKKFTGTTVGTQGSSIMVSHGLTGSKILSIMWEIEFTSGSWIHGDYQAAAGYSSACYHTSTDILIFCVGGNSVNILSKPIKITVIYEE